MRERIAALDAKLPPDLDTVPCLGTMTGYWKYSAAAAPFLEPHLDLEPPLELPLEPFADFCSRGGPLCALCLDHARVIWTRRRRLAIMFAGITEESIR